MILFLGGVLVACVMFAVCITPYYKETQQHDERSKDENESSEDESTLVQIQIEDLEPRVLDRKITSREPIREHGSIDSKKNKKHNEIARDSVYSGEERLMPVKVYTYEQARVSGKIWSPVMKDQLENIKNSSSEMVGTTRIVQAQIERNPKSSSSIEPIGALANQGNYLGNIPIPNHATDEKARKLSSGVIKTYKSLKKIIRPRSQKPLNKLKKSGTQSVPTETSNQPLKLSSILQKNVSTSTRLSVNGSNLKTRNDEVVIRHGSDDNETMDETVRHLPPDPRQSNKGPFQEVVSLIRRETTNGKSICDVRIKGLAVNQSQLLELFNAVEGVNRSASIVITEEASVLTIKFNRRRESNEKSHARNTSFFECPLTNFYKNLPQIFEDLSGISKLFLQDVSNSHSKNDSSYKSFPKNENRRSSTGKK